MFHCAWWHIFFFKATIICRYFLYACCWVNEQYCKAFLFAIAWLASASAAHNQYLLAVVVSISTNWSRWDNFFIFGDDNMMWLTGWAPHKTVIGLGCKQWMERNWGTKPIKPIIINHLKKFLDFLLLLFIVIFKSWSCQAGSRHCVSWSHNVV